MVYNRIMNFGDITTTKKNDVVVHDKPLGQDLNQCGIYYKVCHIDSYYLEILPDSHMFGFLKNQKTCAVQESLEQEDPNSLSYSMS